MDQSRPCLGLLLLALGVASQSNAPFKVNAIAGGHQDCYPRTRLWQLRYGYLSGQLQNPYYPPELYGPKEYTTAATRVPQIGNVPNNPADEVYYRCPLSDDVSSRGFQSVFQPMKRP